MTPPHADAVRANMAKEVRAGRRSVVPPGGRLDGRPILFSPIGIVEKRVWRPTQGPHRFAPVTKLREIHHLSYPTRGTGISVNDLLTSKCGKYGSIDMQRLQDNSAVLGHRGRGPRAVQDRRHRRLR